MPRKIKDISNGIFTPEYELSQTPDNYSPNNYYDNMLQKKIDYDWQFRPNRVTVEYLENKEVPTSWRKIEMVMQHIKSDTGDSISDDYRRLVFRNIRQTVTIGTKWRFSIDYHYYDDEKDKNIWLTYNKDTTSITSSVSIVRCNNNIGSVYIDENGIRQYHYEPVVLPDDLSGTNFFYNQVAVGPQNKIKMLVQFNSFTNAYFYNQRFILGPITSLEDISKNRVYRIVAFDKFYGNTTWKKNDTGIMAIYLEIVDSAPQDDFVNGIAYNQEDNKIPVIKNNDDNNYVLKFIEPSVLPLYIYNTPTKFEVALFKNEEKTDFVINISHSLEGTLIPEKYYSFEQDGNTFVITRKKPYYSGKLMIECKIPEDKSPTGEEISISFELGLEALEN